MTRLARLRALRERWRGAPREGREWTLVLVTGLLIASILGGVTATDEVSWRQMTGFALAMVFYALFALGLSLEFGYTGLLNLGHVAFMAIGAYTYGILMMQGGRPDNAAPVVGWLFDQTAKLEGGSPAGIAVSLVVGLLAAAALLIPLLLSMEAAARRETALPADRRRLLVGPALFVLGAAAVWGANRFGAGGRPGFVAGLTLAVLFAGFLAALAGALLTLRDLVRLVVGRTPLGHSRRARAIVAGVLALALAVVVFRAIHPLDEDGARAVGVLFAVLLGMALAALVALLLGLPAIRLREDYLAIVTLGFAEILRSVLRNEEEWTRGQQPIQSFPLPVQDWVSKNDWWRDMARDAGVRASDLALLVVSTLILVYVYVLLRSLSESPWGRVLKAIREDEDAAAALGKPVPWFKLQALMIGSAIAALAGVMYVSQTGLIAQTQYIPTITFYAFIIIVIGGIGSHKGAIIGAVILWGIFFWARNAGLEAIGVESGPAQLIVVGIVLIAIMMFRPQGLVGRKEELLFAK